MVPSYLLIVFMSASENCVNAEKDLNLQEYKKIFLILDMKINQELFQQSWTCVKLRPQWNVSGGWWMTDLRLMMKVWVWGWRLVWAGSGGWGWWSNHAIMRSMEKLVGVCPPSPLLWQCQNLIKCWKLQRGVIPTLSSPQNVKHQTLQHLAMCPQILG